MFHLYEDFSLFDKRNCSYRIKPYLVSAFSHGHSKILDDGKYHLYLEGCKHYLATPALQDFDLRITFDYIPYKKEDGGGLWIYFRYDKNAEKGHALRVYWDRQNCLCFELDGTEFYTKQYDKLPDDLNDLQCRLKVNGNHGVVEFYGQTQSFTLPDSGYPEKGYIAMDMVLAPSAVICISEITLDSPDPLPITPLHEFHYKINKIQGFQEPVTYDVKISRYDSGEFLLQAVLGGTVMDRGERIETGGSEWIKILEKLTSPYLRFESGNGETLEQIFFFHGTELLYDRTWGSEEQNNKEWLTKLSWPLHLELVLPSLPEQFLLAAGYEHAINSVMQMMEHGPYEQIMTQDGTMIYEGSTIHNDTVAFQVKSPENKKIVSMIPADIPQRNVALKFAQEQHFFFESEKVSFNINVFFRNSVFEEEEMTLDVQFTSVFGDLPEQPECHLKKISSASLPGGIHVVKYQVTIEHTPPCGVWHLVSRMMAGNACLTEDITIFEVLSDDPEGPCPPLESGLPLLISMPSEIKYLENNVFDPWNDYCGMGHYFTGDSRYPAIGARLQLHRLLAIYRRRWFVWSWVRNTDNYDMYNDFNQDLMRNAWYFGGSDNHYSNSSRYDFNVFYYYKGSQLQKLRDYTAEKNPPFKLLTLEKIDNYLAKNEFISFEELRDLFETCWDDFLDYAWKKVDEETQEFCDYLFNINPKLAKGSYGPTPIYVERYKTAYALRHLSTPLEKDPRIRKNGSFWFLEDYHYSCDYPLCRSAFFVASYDFYCSDSRLIYPEIYTQLWIRCEDGAVYQAHPLPGAYLSPLHQKRLVYQFTYGTPQFRNGTWKYWNDYGFHARNPEKESLQNFVLAWGKMLKNQPVSAPKAPYVLLDLEQLKRHGDYFEDQCNFHIGDKTYEWEISNINNTAEEALSYTNEVLCADGRSVPVMTNFDSIDQISADMTDFLILPPIVKNTPPEIIAAIRAAHERGIPLLCFESVCGLEDIFGVKENPAGERTVSYLPDEPFSHKLAKCKYLPDGAECILYGAENAASPLDIPIVLLHQTTKGRTVFVNAPPTVLRRSSLRSNYNMGQDGLSVNVRKALKKSFDYLAPAPAIKASRGSVCSAWNKDGELIVILSDDSPIFNDTATYPAKIKLTLQIPDIGKMKAEADAPYSILIRENDKLVILTETLKDDALFFKFSM